MQTKHQVENKRKQFTMLTNFVVLYLYLLLKLVCYILQNTSNSETTSPTIDVDVEPKKRKACDDEQIQKPESKKSSATSKLQKFSFVKP